MKQMPHRVRTEQPNECGLYYRASGYTCPNRREVWIDTVAGMEHVCRRCGEIIREAQKREA